LTELRPGLSRRHLVAGALGAVSLPLAAPALGRGIETPATEADRRFMRLALEEAALGDYPFGAVIVGDGAVLAHGRNLGKQERDPTAHGEMVAIRNFLAAHGPEKLKGTTLYTSGESCPMCMGAIVWCGISRVVFGAWDQKAGACGSVIDLPRQPKLANRIDVFGGVCSDESAALLRKFFAARR
jgi:tRNA(Arg) A34 adenosine deaminase TadA